MKKYEVKMALYVKGRLRGIVEVDGVEVKVPFFSAGPGMTAKKKEARLIERAKEIVSRG